MKLIASGVAICAGITRSPSFSRSEEHTSELQSLRHLVCRLLLEKKKYHATRTLAARKPHTRGTKASFFRFPAENKLILRDPKLVPHATSLFELAVNISNPLQYVL